MKGRVSPGGQPATTDVTSGKQLGHLFSSSEPDLLASEERVSAKMLSDLEYKYKEYLERRRQVIFLFATGACLIALGIGVTWYGDSVRLNDLLIIGPGCIIIGTGLVLVGVGLLSRILYLRHKTRRWKKSIDDSKETQGKTRLSEYQIPGNGNWKFNPETHDSPSRVALYGADGRNSARSASRACGNVSSAGAEGASEVATYTSPEESSPPNNSSPELTGTDNVEHDPYAMTTPIISFPREVRRDTLCDPTPPVYTTELASKIKRPTTGEGKMEKPDRDNQTTGQSQGDSDDTQGQGHEISKKVEGGEATADNGTLTETKGDPRTDSVASTRKVAFFLPNDRENSEVTNF